MDSDSVGFRERLKESLKLDLPYSYRLPLPTGQLSAVLMLWRFTENGPELLITKRSSRVATHPGHFAFPGGIQDPEDQREGAERWPIVTACRETEEEVGIARTELEVIGELPPIGTLSGFTIHPVVAMLKSPHTELSLSAEEIEFASWFSLREWGAPEVYRREPYTVQGMRVFTDVFLLAGEHRVWGASAALVRNLLDRMGKVELT